MQGNSVTTVFEALCSIEHLDHYNNNSVRESWEKCPSAPQPTVQIEIQIPLTLESISPCPTRTSKTQAIADTGCQSCTSILTQLGLDTSHLTPTSMKMRAANQDLIEIVGAFALRITGFTQSMQRKTTCQIVYILQQLTNSSYQWKPEKTLYHTPFTPLCRISYNDKLYENHPICPT